MIYLGNNGTSKTRYGTTFPVKRDCAGIESWIWFNFKLTVVKKEVSLCHKLIFSKIPLSVSPDDVNL